MLILTNYKSKCQNYNFCINIYDLFYEFVLHDYRFSIFFKQMAYANVCLQ